MDFWRVAVVRVIEGAHRFLAGLLFDYMRDEVERSCDQAHTAVATEYREPVRHVWLARNASSYVSGFLSLP